MKALAFPLLALTLAGTAASARTPARDYPSCDLAAQRSLPGDTGPAQRDPRQAHIAMRANVLQADIATARRARRLPQREADRLWRDVDTVRSDADGYVRTQGFLSAAERASYDRALDAVATRICRR